MLKGQINKFFVNVKAGGNQRLGESLYKSKVSIENPKSFFTQKKENIFLCFFAILIFLYGTYRLSEVGQPILFNDEFGYWAASSFFLGIDWSSFTSQIGYYSYGYGILLALVRCVAYFMPWDWRMIYQAAVVLNAIMLVAGFFLAVKLSKRYFERMNWIVRGIVCFASIIYPSNIIYSHITWTENTLTFFFWLFLYLLMRCIDKPSVKNHIGLALTVFYMYVVHQRALSILMTGVLIILFIRLLRINQWKDTAAFFGSVYVCTLIHFMIKGKLQNDFYLGNEPADFKATIGYAFDTKAILLLLVLAGLLFVLYLLDKGKVKLVLVLGGVTLLAGVLVLVYGNGFTARELSDGEIRLSTNDFSGQWGKIKGIFTVNGALRLGISIVGKWFYLAAATGLIICWAMKDLIKHGFWMCVYSVKVMWQSVTGKVKTDLEGQKLEIVEESTEGKKAVETKEVEKANKAQEYICDKKNVWLFGVLLAWLSTFMVCAVYKEGFYKVDDLVNGRYNEYVIGIMLVLGFECLLADKKWLRTACICIILYILSGVLCQTVFDEIGRTDFELAHSVMFGRVFWNWEVPYGKVKKISGYILPMGVSFLIIIKLFSTKFPRIAAARCIIGLLIPICAWTYLANAIIGNYVVVRNEKQAVGMPDVAFWIRILRSGENIYYLADTQDYRWGEGIQFMLQDKEMTLTTSTEVPWEEDAFFVMHTDYAYSEEVQEKCVVVVESGVLTLAVNKEQGIAERWSKFER